MKFTHITSDPEILGGKPILKGTRISVEFILELVASGGSIAEIVLRYPHLQFDAVQEAIHFAVHNLKNDFVLEA